MSFVLSPCIEWLFAEGGRPFPDRVRAAAAAGFEAVEFWTASSKDVEDLERAIRDTGLRVTAFVSEPTARLVDPTTHGEFVEGVRRSCALAARINARGLIAVSGDTRVGVPRDEQLASVAEALQLAAPIAADASVTLLLEPLNTLVDHRGYFLDSTAEALGVIRTVAHPAVRLLYDLYHSAVMGENTGEVLAGAGALVGHVHLADAPGRHEPGTGRIDWRRALVELRAAGYTGALGLEYMPLRDTTSSVELIQRLAGETG